MKGGGVHTQVNQEKQRVREQVWGLLAAADAVHDASVWGRIPNFKGTQAAADRLACLPQWTHAQVIKAVPDKAQLAVRARALAEGKTVFMAVPKLAEPLPFYLLDPATLTVPPAAAASSKVAATIAPKVDVESMPPVDIVVVGSVAVNRLGVRIGKGAGYSDLEFAFLMEAGLITSHTIVVTTVHALQVVDEELPRTNHDFDVDLIVTPDDVISCRHARRPSGIVWEDLDADKIASIPALAARAPGTSPSAG